MSDQKETRFKITDRRKFNADGSPREMTEPDPAGAIPDTKPASDTARNNVVSFPGDGPKTSANASSPASSEGTNAPPTPGARNAVDQRAERAEDQHRAPGQPGVPDPAFIGLLNMLAIEAELALGLIAGQGEEAPEVNLDAARQLIDTLAMLKNKTRGNLNAQEDNLLDEILTYLRMQFVQVSRG